MSCMNHKIKMRQERGDMKYNILYIANESVLGGAALSLLDMLKAVKGRLINPIVIIPTHGTIEENLIELSIPYYVVGFSRGYGKIGGATQEDANRNFLDNYQAACQLQDIIKKEKIDLIHINSSVTNVGAFAALMAGIPYVWHFREFLEEDFDCEFWDKSLKRELIKRAASIISISKIVQDSYKKKYDVKSICIYDGLDIEKYKTALRSVDFDKEIHRFLITGNVTKNKGQFDALRAIKLLIDEGIRNIELVLVGNITTQLLWVIKHYIEKYELERNITIMPFQKDLFEIRKNCGYSLTTSKYEALGRCTIEAMLAGHIVIGADTAGTKEIIGTDESRGYLYSQGDYKELAEVMKRVIFEDKAKRNLCRKNAQKHAENEFSNEVYGMHIIGVYERILKSTKKECGNKQFLKNLENRYINLTNNITRTVEEINIFNPRAQSIRDNWSLLAQRGINIGTFLLQNGYKEIAIYGMGNFGQKLYDELVDAGISIPYVIDKNPGYLGEVVPVKQPKETMEDIEMLIVTVANEEDEIADRYRKNARCLVKTLSEILKEVLGAKV